MSVLKPCPFCGGESEVYSAIVRRPFDDGSLQGHWVADCTICNANIEFNNSEYGAITAWNTRANEQQGGTE